MKYPTLIISLRKEEVKYHNLTSTNTESFCYKIPHLADYANVITKSEDNTSVIRNKPLTQSLIQHILPTVEGSYTVTCSQKMEEFHACQILLGITRVITCSQKMEEFHARQILLGITRV